VAVGERFQPHRGGAGTVRRVIVLGPWAYGPLRSWITAGLWRLPVQSQELRLSTHARIDKEGQTHMDDSSDIIVAGIDVSKAHLDVVVLPGDRYRRWSYDPPGLEQLVQWLRSLKVEMVVLEAIAFLTHS